MSNFFFIEGCSQKRCKGCGESSCAGLCKVCGRGLVDSGAAFACMNEKCLQHDVPVEGFE